MSNQFIPIERDQPFVIPVHSIIKFFFGFYPLEIWQKV